MVNKLLTGLLLATMFWTCACLTSSISQYNKVC